MFYVTYLSWYELAETVLAVVLLVSTDFEEYKFIDSKFVNCSFDRNNTGCQIAFDDDYSAYWIYFVNFLGTLAVLPGNIVSALLMDRIGRLTMLGMGCALKWGGKEIEQTESNVDKKSFLFEALQFTKVRRNP